MRVVLQRVKEASVSVDGKTISKIDHGFLILLGIGVDDTNEDIAWLARKIVNLRVFVDEDDAMNNSIVDVKGNVIVVSQFTLQAKIKKGNRPSFIKAAKPDLALSLYKDFIQAFENEFGKKIQTGEFGAMMDVQLVNDGPVTILIDTKNKE